MLKAIEAVRNEGVTVRKVITIVDRLEGAGANLAGHGIELACLYDANDFRGR